MEISNVTKARGEAQFNTTREQNYVVKARTDTFVIHYYKGKQEQQNQNFQNIIKSSIKVVLVLLQS